MKIIRKDVLYGTIKKELKDGIKWCKGDSRRSYSIMLDTSDASVWCDVFLSDGDTKVYKSRSILNLTRFMPDFLEFHYVDNRDVAEGYCKCAKYCLENAGWVIE